MILKKIFIENKPNQRIIIDYKPLENTITIIGQYKVNGELPVNYYEKIVELNKLYADLSEIIYDVAIELDRRITQSKEFIGKLNQIDYFHCFHYQGFHLLHDNFSYR